MVKRSEEEDMVCEKERLSVVNKVNERKLKMEDSYDVASVNFGKEFGIKCEGEINRIENHEW